MIIFMYPFMSVVSFVITVVAALWAVELYRLLRAGEGGKAWRVLVFATVAFAVHELYTIGRGLGICEFGGIAEITELFFVILLAYAIYTQRQSFFYPQSHRGESDTYKSPFFRGRLSASAVAFSEDHDEVSDEGDACSSDFSRSSGFLTTEVVTTEGHV